MPKLLLKVKIWSIKFHYNSMGNCRYPSTRPQNGWKVAYQLIPYRSQPAKRTRLLSSSICSLRQASRPFWRLSMIIHFFIFWCWHRRSTTFNVQKTVFFITSCKVTFTWYKDFPALSGQAVADVNKFGVTNWAQITKVNCLNISFCVLAFICKLAAIQICLIDFQN